MATGYGIISHNSYRHSKPQSLSQHIILKKHDKLIWYIALNVNKNFRLPFNLIQVGLMRDGVLLAEQNPNELMQLHSKPVTVKTLAKICSFVKSFGLDTGGGVFAIVYKT